MRANDRLIEARRRALWREVAMTRRGRDYHGHRWDQVALSVWVLAVIGGLAAAGFIVGAVYALLTR